MLLELSLVSYHLGATLPPTPRTATAPTGVTRALSVVIQKLAKQDKRLRHRL